MRPSESQAIQIKKQRLRARPKRKTRKKNLTKKERQKQTTNKGNTQIKPTTRREVGGGLHNFIIAQVGGGAYKFNNAYKAMYWQ